MTSAPDLLREDQLVEGLQPIRFFALAQVLYGFFECGAYDILAVSGRYSIDELTRKLDLEPRRLKGVLQFLHNEGYLEVADEQVWLTDRGEALARVRPWYTLFVGGYGQAFQELPSALKAGAAYASRNGKAVAIGSCGISQHDALPMTRELLEKASPPSRLIVDLGCGDGSYLIDLCQLLPGVRGFGLDPNPDSVALANARICDLGLGDRIEVRVGSATEIPDLGELSGPVCFVTAFVLQEVLEQSGREAVVELLAANFRKYPDAQWVVIEVDERATDMGIMSTELGRAYYNPYYLLHHLTALPSPSPLSCNGAAAARSPSRPPAKAPSRPSASIWRC